MFICTKYHIIITVYITYMLQIADKHYAIHITLIRWRLSPPTRNNAEFHLLQKKTNELKTAIPFSNNTPKEVLLIRTTRRALESQKKSSGQPVRLQAVVFFVKLRRILKRTGVLKHHVDITKSRLSSLTFYVPSLSLEFPDQKAREARELYCLFPISVNFENH